MGLDTPRYGGQQYVGDARLQWLGLVILGHRWRISSIQGEIEEVPDTIRGQDKEGPVERTDQRWTKGQRDSEVSIGGV